MKILVLAAVALMTAGPALALTQAEIDKTARVAAESSDPWQIKTPGSVGPVELPPVLVEGPVTAPSSAVPEPASWALMVGGFGLVGGALRRRSMARVSA